MSSMHSILQGTTPTFNFNFADSGLSVGDLTAAELTITSRAMKLTKALSAMTVDTANNKLSYAFTEEETLELDHVQDAWYQLFVKVGSQIYGTKKKRLDIHEDIKGEAMA